MMRHRDVKRSDACAWMMMTTTMMLTTTMMMMLTTIIMMMIVTETQSSVYGHGVFTWLVSENLFKASTSIASSRDGWEGVSFIGLTKGPKHCKERSKRKLIFDNVFS